MRKIEIVLIFLTSFVFAIPAYSKPLEFADRADLRIRVKEESHENNKRLHIRVSMAESAKLIGRPKTKVSGKTLQLFLFLHWFSKTNKVAGQADFYLSIPEGVERVTFGKQKCEIWPRNLGAKRLNPEQARVQSVALERFNIDFPNTDPFDIAVRISRYGTPLATTYLKGDSAEYEVVIWQAKERVIYQISNCQIVRTVSQREGVDY